MSNGSVTARLRRQVTETSAALEAVTKERDDAREQLARVCAQVDEAGVVKRHLERVHAEVDRQRVEAQKEVNELRGQINIMTDELRRLHRLRTATDSKDARILDCVATLLAMREAP